VSPGASAAGPPAGTAGPDPARVARERRRRRKARRRALVRPFHPLIYAGVRTALAASRTAGIEPALHAARAMAPGYARMPFNRDRLRRAVDNIRWAFPHFEEDRAEAIAVESYRHLFSLAVEITHATTTITEDNFFDVIELSDVEEVMSTLDNSEPCLLLTGHVGNWELLGLVLAILGLDIHALYRPLDVPQLNAWLYRERTSRGLRLIDKFGAAEQLPPVIESGSAVGFIADQNAGEKGLFVPFFDRLASAYKTIGVLAMRYNATIVCGQAVRLNGLNPISSPLNPDTELDRLFRYRLDCVDLIRPEDWADQPDPLFYLTARYRRAIERMVRSAPEQYLWMHRYWKSRPRHEREAKPFPKRLREKIEALPWMTDQQMGRILERSERDAAELSARRRGPAVH
jgi:KDO2-lipid IV(A) lauroyltransferase